MRVSSSIEQVLQGHNRYIGYTQIAILEIREISSCSGNVKDFMGRFGEQICVKNLTKSPQFPLNARNIIIQSLTVKLFRICS